MMQALRLTANQTLELLDIPIPVPGAGQVRVRIQYLALNHIDCYGFRGMAFAKRKLPITIGAEAMGMVDSVGGGVSSDLIGQSVALSAGTVCGSCGACQDGRENLCENAGGINGFHTDGFAAQYAVVNENQVFQVPGGVDPVHAACATTTFATVQHMLFDNAKLTSGQIILVHAGGSGIGSTAIRFAKSVGATVIATAGTEEKCAKCIELGADYVVNYQTDRFDRFVRRLTKKRGVDVVFEHVGPDTWAGSLFSLKKGGVLVTCGSTSGIQAETNLLHLFNQQIRIFASFGGTFENVRCGLEKMKHAKTFPIIDRIIPIDEIDHALQRLLNRDVFGKIIVDLTRLC